MSAFLEKELNILVYWIEERDRIRVLKEAGAPKPWTADPLLRDYRWCNVRRMDDLVSRQLMEQWYRYDSTPKTALEAATLARLINWPETLMDITEGAKYNGSLFGRVATVLRDRGYRGDKVFTGAYMIPGIKGLVKAVSVPQTAAAVSATAMEIYDPTSQRNTWRQLIKVHGLGSFLAGQITSDVACLQAGKGWTDTATWAPVGPGSARGLNRLLGRDYKKAVSQAMFEEYLPKLIEVVRPRVAAIWEDRKLVAIDLQNCACEIDKYMRLQLGQGKVRANYPGKA